MAQPAGALQLQEAGKGQAGRGLLLAPKMVAPSVHLQALELLPIDAQCQREMSASWLQQMGSV
jgi:hypothetical protein